ncbi:MAG: hypothetical protein EPO11_08240 [Gammaproteobacteria bacterium]|nr:MAG: hypothetical protein EPO11_08240 [Gammaproteobacteria bacterium]
MNKLALLSMLLAPATSFAFFCPTNFNQIDFGATTMQVEQICGKPDKQETTIKKSEGPQEWSYYVQQTVSTTGGMTSMEGTLKTQIAFDAEGKAINISVNGVGVGSTTLCGTSIQLGSTKDAVKAACGEPAFINKAQPSDAPPPQETKIVTYTYNANPPVKLIFEDGVLKDKQ